MRRPGAKDRLFYGWYATHKAGRHTQTMTAAGDFWGKYKVRLYLGHYLDTTWTLTGSGKAEKTSRIAQNPEIGRIKED